MRRSSVRAGAGDGVAGDMRADIDFIDLCGLEKTFGVLAIHAGCQEQFEERRIDVAIAATQPRSHARMTPSAPQPARASGMPITNLPPAAKL